MKCYTVSADTCQMPKITFSQSELSFDKAKLMATILSGGFRDVRVMNEVTGEVEFNIYSSSEFFSPVCAVAEALKKVGV